MTVDVHCAERIMTVTLARPERNNAIDASSADALDQAWQRLDDDPVLDVAILQAEVRHERPVFCSGQDLKTLEVEPGAGRRPTGFAGLTRRSRSKPVIAAVDGLATSGGFELVLACDLVVATIRSSFSLAEVQWDLFAAAGGLMRLPRSVGTAVALDLALTGDELDATHAYALGVVSTLVPEGDDIRTVARERAQAIARNGSRGVAATVRLVRSAHGSDGDFWQRNDVEMDGLDPERIAAGTQKFRDRERTHHATDHGPNR